MFPELAGRGTSQDLSFHPFFQIPTILSAKVLYSQSNGSNMSQRDKVTIIHPHVKRKTAKGKHIAKDSDITNLIESDLQ